MDCKVITPQGVVYDKRADRITLPGTLGDFTVLRNHAPILTTLRKGTVSILTGEQMESIEVETGVVEVNRNKVRIMTG